MTTKTENPDSFLVEFTNERMIDHLLLLEDHFLEYSRKPTAQCLACVYWHLRKLVAYASLECVKFTGTDIPACQSLSEWASKTQDKLDKLKQPEALKIAKEARDFRYKLVDSQPPKGKAKVRDIVAELFEPRGRVAESGLWQRSRKPPGHSAPVSSNLTPSANKAVVRYKRNYGLGRSVFFVEYEYNGERYITGTVIRGTDKSLGWYFGKGGEGLKEANRISLLPDEEFSKAEYDKRYSWEKTKQALSETEPIQARLFQPATLTKEVSAIKSIASELTTACPEGGDKTYQSIIRDLTRRADRLATIELPAPGKPCPEVLTVPSAPASNKTFATGITGITRYDFEYKIVDATKLVVSHNAFTFQPNVNYPAELQPRLRERAATKLQVQYIAANLDPKALLIDYKSIDRGAPIIGKDSVVESGNGRVMAIVLASRDHPALYQKYVDELKAIAPTYALNPKDVDKLHTPILVRERLTDVPRKQFVEEANASTSIERSAVEMARTDAQKITATMLSALEVLEGEAIEDALRSPRNKQFVTAFLSKLPSTEQARLVDAKGILNQDGVRRTAMAVFVATFKGDVGLRLAGMFFESTDPNVRNIFNGIARSLGVLAQAESMTAESKRQPEYAFGEDLAKAVSVYSAIKKTPGMTVPKYIAQLAMGTRELSVFQERVLIVLDQHSRSARRIATILSGYAQAVIDSPAPAQAAFMPEARATKEQLFEQAVKTATAVLEDIIARLFAPRTVTVPKEQMAFEWIPVPVPPPETGAPAKIIPTTTPPPPVSPPSTAQPPPKYRLFPFQEEGVAWLKGRSYALLADDMGLGKTPQAIHWGADHQPVLVVVPSSLVLNWQREIHSMWRPNDTVLILDGKTELPTKLPDWTIMSYGMLNHYLKPITRRDFSAIICDEAHLVKNMDTQRTKNVLELVIPSEPEEGREPHRVIPNRLAVTGTPVLNRPIELFALLLFLGVKKRGDYRDFLETYTQHKYVKGRLVFTGSRNLYQLNQELKPFMLRRLKKDVLKQLPPKINTPMFVPISNAAEYREAEVNFLRWLRETAGDEAAIRAATAEIIVKMNALRRLAAIGKVAPTCDWLKPCRDGQGKVLVFCSFTEPLESLRRCKPESVLYTGALSSQERQKIVDEFQKATGVCYFMGTIGAAGVGITLTAANRVAFMDLPWTPGGKIQAEDRAHRIGQTQTVEIVNILAKGTIDERMLQLLAEKELVIAQAVDGKTRDEAASTSVANALIEEYIRAPTLGEPIQYEPELADPEMVEVDAEQLEILQGLRDSLLSDYSWLARKIDPCNLSVRDVDAALNFKPLRNIVTAAVGAKAKVSLCSAGFVYGHYQLTIDGLTYDAETKILNTVLKTPGLRQVHTAVPGQKVFEVVVPQVKKEKEELGWSPQEVIRQVRREPAEQVAMFDSTKRKPKEIIITADTIAKHYKPVSAFHKGSIRTLVQDGTRIRLGCPVKEKWDPGRVICSRQTLMSTVVPNSAKYMAEVKAWQGKGVKVTHGKEMQASDVVAEPVDAEEAKAIENAEKMEK